MFESHDSFQVLNVLFMYHQFRTPSYQLKSGSITRQMSDAIEDYLSLVSEEEDEFFADEAAEWHINQDEGASFQTCPEITYNGYLLLTHPIFCEFVICQELDGRPNLVQALVRHQVDGLDILALGQPFGNYGRMLLHNQRFCFAEIHPELRRSISHDMRHADIE